MPVDQPDRGQDTQGEHPDSDRHSDQHSLEEHQHPGEPGSHAGVPSDFDVEEPTDAGEGEPVHHNTGDDLGAGGD
jgi:hypothetical protein